MLNELLAALPAHKAGLSIEHNQHKNCYETVGRWIVGNEWAEWESDEAKQKAIDIDEVWTIQWYPETPIGFCAIAAPTLDDLFRLVNDDS